VKEGILPPSLSSTVVLPSNFDSGIKELSSPPRSMPLYQQDWLRVSSGV